MHGKTQRALLGYGLISSLIEKIDECGHTIAFLRAVSRKNLLKSYTAAEADEIKDRIERAPIPEAVVTSILSKSGGACCFCDDGNSVRPFQLHHVDPYSETQDNSEKNLLLICPTDHVTVHENKVPRQLQKHIRSRWYTTVSIAKEFSAKGLAFPYGEFSSLEYDSTPQPSELVSLGPLSPSTASLCAPPELKKSAEERLAMQSFLIVFGGSGSGKSTFAIALGGDYAGRGYRVIRHRFNKRKEDTLKQVYHLLSACVKNTFLILDDANIWATASDLQDLAKAVYSHPTASIIATCTSDDSSDGAKLHASGVPRLTLLWSDLKPFVVDLLLKNEGEIVSALLVFESPQGWGLGHGSMHMPLRSRIASLGEKPNSVYEFLFSLRGNSMALKEELNSLVGNDRSDVPMLFVAIEQIAGFERTVSVDETVIACQKVETQGANSPATKEWIRRVFDQELNKRRLVHSRGTVTTIHRRWAAGLISTALQSRDTQATTESLLRPDFDVSNAEPLRLLRLWSWLRPLDGSRAFVNGWITSVTSDGWSCFVRRCAEKGLLETGFLAHQMHRLGEFPKWEAIVGEAFSASKSQIGELVSKASSSDWQSLQHLSTTLGHADPQCLKDILDCWPPAIAGEMLQSSPPHYFQIIDWFLGQARAHNASWAQEVGSYITWDRFSQMFAKIETGDLDCLYNCFEVLMSFGGVLRRSMIRTVTDSMHSILAKADLESLHMPDLDQHLLVIAVAFPGDVKSALEGVNVKKIAEQLSNSLPRHWHTVCELGYWCKTSGCPVPREIISLCDITRLHAQAERYAPDSRFDFRLLLHFLYEADEAERHKLATLFQPLVFRICEPRDSETSSILTAFCNLDEGIANAVAAQLDLQIEKRGPVDFASLDSLRKRCEEHRQNRRRLSNLP